MNEHKVLQYNLAENKFKRVQAERDTKRIGKNAFSRCLLCVIFLHLSVWECSSSHSFQNIIYHVLTIWICSPNTYDFQWKIMNNFHINATLNREHFFLRVCLLQMTFIHVNHMARYRNVTRIKTKKPLFLWKPHQTSSPSNKLIKLQ